MASKERDLGTADFPFVPGVVGYRNSILAGEVHLWSTRLEDLEKDEESIAYYSRLLCAEENVRASRYVFRRDQTRFILCRGILRELLGSYLSVPAELLEIFAAAQGKPRLVRSGQDMDLRFNLSHSHGFVILAFTIGRDIGVDTELIRPEIAAEEIARNYFSAVECTELDGLGNANRARGFFLCWTRKEAYIKARGDGLSKIPLDSFSVTLTPGAPARLYSADSDRWSLHSIEISRTLAAALVVEGMPTRIVTRQHLRPLR